MLDLADERGLYAGKMLADLGADVIKIEPPGGGKARRTPPFKGDSPGLENSLYFLNFNTNKRGITLNIDSPVGQGILKRLVERSDVLIEDGDVGRMRSLGLDYQTFRKVNSGIIMASITGFGQAGPYSAYKAPDMVSFAMGGMMNINGPADAPPVVAPCEQAYHSVSVVAVFGIVSALFLRMRTGEGQLVDASAQEVLASISGGVVQYGTGSQIAGRSGSQFGAVPGRIYPCKDGFVHILTIRPNHWRGLLEVMGNPEEMAGPEWFGGEFRNRNVDLIDAHVTEFTMSSTKMEIAELCQAHGVPCTPVNTASDFSHDPHVRERGFFVQVQHPVLGRHSYLRPPYIMGETPCRVVRPAPLLGQHNHEVYCGELGCSREELAALEAQGVI